MTGLRRALDHLSAEESEAVWGRTAQRFYGIPDDRLDAAASAV